MFSFKGPGFKVFAAILAVIALGVGVYFTFFQSKGYEKTEATIVSIENDPDSIPDADTENDVRRIVTVKYTVGGREYTTQLDSDSPSYEVGKTVKIMYDPKNPEKITSSKGFGVYLMIAGAVILLLVVGLTVKKKIDVKKLKEAQGETVYAPSEQGEERELYFLTDLGTPKYGHRIEDRNRSVLYEAKMTKFTLAGPFGFDFIDHEHGTTRAHLVGHQEETDWNSFLIDNHYTFSLDGEDVWKHLKRNGVKVESRFAQGKVLFPSYTVSRDGAEIGRIEASSQYVHEEDAEEHAIADKVPIPGFYRIFTSEKNLDLLFVVALAFARSGATDDKGGSRKILFNTLKG
jgi:hypothetical protein